MNSIIKIRLADLHQHWRVQCGNELVVWERDGQGMLTVVNVDLGAMADALLNTGSPGYSHFIDVALRALADELHQELEGEAIDVLIIQLRQLAQVVASGHHWDTFKIDTFPVAPDAAPPETTGTGMIDPRDDLQKIRDRFYRNHIGTRTREQLAASLFKVHLTCLSNYYVGDERDDVDAPYPWPDDLALADVVDKHVCAQNHDTINALVDKLRDVGETDFLKTLGF